MSTMSEDQYQALSNHIADEFANTLIALTAKATDLKELNYIKMPMYFDNGSRYLLSILHLEGPKFDLEALRRHMAADDSIGESSNGRTPGFGPGDERSNRSSPTKNETGDG